MCFVQLTVTYVTYTLFVLLTKWCVQIDASEVEESLQQG